MLSWIRKARRFAREGVACVREARAALADRARRADAREKALGEEAAFRDEVRRGWGAARVERDWNRVHGRLAAGDLMLAAEEEARRALRAEMPDNPAGYGWRAFSQYDEDGVAAHCLARLGARTPLSRACVEVGCGTGLENNTHQLLLDGYRGVWFDADAAHIEGIARGLGGTAFPALLVQHAFFNAANAASMMAGAATFLGTDDLDFLSLDIDGNDVAVVRAALGAVRPKLLCVEYNAKFPPPRAVVMPYDERHAWAGDDYYGASLQGWVDRLPEYRLVACTAAGINAFFARADLADAFTAYPAERLYRPARMAWLLAARGGHPSGFRWLRSRLASGA